MSLVYPIKHVFRGWKLFVALLIGVTLAATFLAGIGVKTNVAAEQALDMQLSSIRTDMSLSVSLNQTNVPLIVNDISSVYGVKSVDMLAQIHVPLNVTNSNYTSYAPMVSFPNTSHIYDEWKISLRMRCLLNLVMLLLVESWRTM